MCVCFEQPIVVIRWYIVVFVWPPVAWRGPQNVARPQRCWLWWLGLQTLSSNCYMQVSMWSTTYVQKYMRYRERGRERRRRERERERERKNAITDHISSILVTVWPALLTKTKIPFTKTLNDYSTTGKYSVTCLSHDQITWFYSPIQWTCPPKGAVARRCSGSDGSHETTKVCWYEV